MFNIQSLLKKYHSKIDYLDLELIIAHVLKKSREFVLAHSEETITKKQETITKKLIKRRIKNEPLAYILGHKEFYGLDFKVNKNVLIPRPETELLVEEVLKYIKNNKPYIILDVGTGSGNIIISVAQKTKSKNNIKNKLIKYFAVDNSSKALSIAKQNAKKHKTNNKIKFIKGNFTSPILNTLGLIHDSDLIFVANLPYVSSAFYKKYYNKLKHEPKNALFSQNKGLAHYQKLFKQIKKFYATHLTFNIFLEFSPQQKIYLEKMIKINFPYSKIIFKKDLAKKYRVAIIFLNCG